MSDETKVETEEKKPETDGAKPVPPLKAILAQKVGMTRVFSDKGEIVPVTVLQAGPCPVVQVKTKEKDGYPAVQLGFGDVRARNVSKPRAGHFAPTGAAPTRWLREFRLADAAGFEPGMRVTVDQFAAGDIVDVGGVIKGKGFAGGVKRHRFKGGPKTHGQSDRWRAPGSSGRERVWPGKRGPGHMGVEWGTVQRLEVVGVEAADNLMLIRGSVPGTPGSLVTVYGTTRPRPAAKAKADAAKKGAKGAKK